MSGPRGGGGEAENARLRETARKLTRVGMALAHEHDRVRLLELILTSAREIAECDAGSLYLVQKVEGRAVSELDDLADKRLYFKLAQNDSVRVAFHEIPLEISPASIAGFVALTGEPLELDDVSRLPEGAPYRVDRSFDESTGYGTVSMLCLPMKDQQGRLLGVLQLINRRRDPSRPLGVGAAPDSVLPFDRDSVEHAMSLAGQAAVAIENSELYAEIRRMFEAFVRASVGAVEARDPTTAGHSERVAAYVRALAAAVSACGSGPYAGVSFSGEQLLELEYASLLHDFGKIGVREAVLVKAKKLYPHELAIIEQRSRVMALHLRLAAAQRRLEAVASGGRAEELAAIERSLSEGLAALERDVEAVRRANDPAVLEDEHLHRVTGLSRRPAEAPGADAPALISDDEARRLGIRRGCLSEDERREIERHVDHTFEYLSGIPWPKGLRRVPELAYGHHEKLDGTGYPRGLKGERIPLEARMMAVCDIYDALTAWDRPYKKAMPVERALAVLQEEARRGGLDPEVVRVFIASKSYEAVKPPAGA